ncbi:MAG: glycosyltransferase family 39 protein [Anaerolineae bacterium]|nr:glycosyltransferase family 39 protein [Anaerolineae bacterium]
MQTVSHSEQKLPNLPPSELVTPPSTATLSRQNIIYMVVISIILIAAALRFLNLGKTNFWYDEMAALRYASNLSTFDVHPPLYYATLNVLLKFNQSEFILRLPSAIAGVVSVLFIYLIGRQLSGLKITILTMLLASISPLLIWHSQEARMYSQALMFVLMTVYFYILILKNGSRFAWLGYAVAAVLAVYSHLYSGLIPITLSIHLLLFRRDLLSRWIIAQAILLVAYTPWLIILASLPAKQIGTVRPVSILHIFYNYYAFTTGYSLGPTINELRAHHISVLIPYLALILPLAITTSILVIAGIYHQWRQNREKAMLIILWATVPVFIAVFIPLLRQSMIFNVRYVLVSLPAYLWLLASGIEKLGRRIGTVALIVIITYSGISLYNHYFNSRYAKEDVRSAANYVTQEIQPDDHILVITVGSLFNWYFHSDNPIVTSSQPQPAIELVTNAARNTNTLWLVEARAWQTDPNGEIKSYLNDNYQVLEERNFSGVQIYKYCITHCVPKPGS